MKKIYLITGLVIFCLSGYGQDVVLSQAYYDDMHLNPAHTGLMDDDNRFSAFYRDQYGSISTPTITAIFSYERKAHSTDKEAVGVGLHIFYDDAGDGNLSTLKIDASAAYGKQLKEGVHFLSMGFRLGYGRRSVELDRLVFSSQNGDPDVSSGEVFNEKFGIFDFGVGMALLSKIKESGSVTFGIAIDNLSNQENSFNGLERSRFIRVNPYMHAEVELALKWKLIPGFYFHNQNASRQYLIQLLAQHKFENSEKELMLDFGAYYRVLDALIPTVGFAFEGLRLGLSYDINHSSLTSATNTRGAFELSFVYSFSRKQ
ncbi:MAG: type IX secretion system membrane protein PorP/SprF [Bacteroidetes bacterium]|nr:type IX secretion system membrane protein PorP/SprF [Bacteroidota bacterium]